MKILNVKTECRSKAIRCTMAALVSLMFVLPAHGQSSLEPVEMPDFDEFYIAEEFSLPPGRKIFIEDVEASFSEDWMRRFRGSTGEPYRQSILERYGQTLKEELATEIEALGWEVVTQRAGDAVILQPRLIELFIFGPEEAALTTSIFSTAGQAGAELTFLSPGGEPFMKIVDYRQTRTSIGSPLIANRANNFRYFRMMMSDWAELAAIYLEEMMLTVERETQ